MFDYVKKTKKTLSETPLSLINPKDNKKNSNLVIKQRKLINDERIFL